MRRFRQPKTENEEKICLDAAVPSSTKYATKWAVTIFNEWKVSRREKEIRLKSSSEKPLQNLDTELEEMNAESVNYWLTKFVQEVSKKDGEPYPSRSLYLIVCGLNRYLLNTKAQDERINILDKSERRLTEFRRVLDAEMKEATRKGYGANTKKERRQEITDEEEEVLWRKGLLGTKSAESLVHTVYYFNGKLFGIRAIEHRNLRYHNIRVENNSIIYDESCSKTFHGGLDDLKHNPREVRHVCHRLDQATGSHERCLVAIYKMYLEKIRDLAICCEAFYFQPHRNPEVFSYQKSPVGINSLNKILPDKLCVRAGLQRKTAHSLRITCATNLFRSGIEEKIIRNRTGHRSDSLFRYEIPEEKQLEKASAALGAVCSHSEGEFKDQFPCFDFGCVKEEEECLEYSVSDFDIQDDVLSCIPMPAFVYSEEISDDCLAEIDLKPYFEDSKSACSTCTCTTAINTPTYNNCSFNITVNKM